MHFLRALARLIPDESGQDVIEYAFLSAFIGLAGISAFNLIGSSMQTAYTAWVTNANADAVVNMPDPAP